MNEDKIFGLLEKFYGEFQELKSDVNGMKNDIRKIDIKIDEQLIPTDKALLDGYKDNAEHIAIIDDKVDRLQMDVNSISIKATYNDSRIIEMSKDIKKAK